MLRRNRYRHILLSLPLLSATAFGGSFPEPAIDARPSTGNQTAVLAGGCFWCTEAVFEIIDGVEDVISGYSGGTKDTAKYDIVSTGRTGHAEAILISYDPAKISYGQLLKIFFSVAHDPRRRSIVREQTSALSTVARSSMRTRSRSESPKLISSRSMMCTS